MPMLGRPLRGGMPCAVPVPRLPPGREPAPPLGAVPAPPPPITPPIGLMRRDDGVPAPCWPTLIPGMPPISPPSGMALGGVPCGELLGRPTAGRIGGLDRWPDGREALGVFVRFEVTGDGAPTPGVEGLGVDVGGPPGVPGLAGAGTKPTPAPPVLPSIGPTPRAVGVGTGCCLIEARLVLPDAVAGDNGTGTIGGIVGAEPPPAERTISSST